MTTEARRAIEALRAGVPNADAVRFLGAGQVAIVQRFERGLDAMRTGATTTGGGFILRGEFGTGKSHILRHLLREALAHGFAASFVVVGKETPLSDLDLVYKAAVKELSLPDRPHGDVSEIAEKLDPPTEAFTAFEAWAREAPGLDPIFEGTMRLWKGLSRNDELREAIQSFWAGGRINITRIKKELRRLGEPVALFKSPKAADIAQQRFAFLAGLIRAAGYAGWVIFLDEVEQIVLLSLRARARAYGELAWLLGYGDRPIPGVQVVAAATSEFTGEIFQRKQDDVKIGVSTYAAKDPATVERAMRALKIIDERSGAWEAIVPQSEADLDRVYRDVRGLYRRAFDWETTEAGRPPYRDVGRRMRMHVREWITRWDLERLDPTYAPDIASEAWVPNLQEREGLEGFSEVDDPDDDAHLVDANP